ncbi:MAG TPA: hypothetical protein VHX14_16025 [Thermoanaerobaculia bacterium]|jgi:hypothetical protein|nr:hypothetical protein [Thermoanaerobaculia bacterium]
MTDGTRILRTAGIPLIIAIALLYVVPKECSKVIAVSKQREAARAASGLHIESAQKPVTYPAGLDAERIRYVVEIDTQFSTPYMGRVRKAAPIALLPREQLFLAALQKLGYAETAPDNTVSITRDGLLHLDGLVDDGTSWTFPVAKREFVSVTAIDSDATTAHATFAWQWKPTAVGSELMPTPKRHESKAELTNSTGRWTLVQISELDGELE